MESRWRSLCNPSRAASRGSGERTLRSTGSACVFASTSARLCPHPTFPIGRAAFPSVRGTPCSGRLSRLEKAIKPPDTPSLPGEAAAAPRGDPPAPSFPRVRPASPLGCRLLHRGAPWRRAFLHPCWCWLACCAWPVSKRPGLPSARIGAGTVQGCAGWESLSRASARIFLCWAQGWSPGLPARKAEAVMTLLGKEHRNVLGRAGVSCPRTDWAAPLWSLGAEVEQGFQQREGA